MGNPHAVAFVDVLDDAGTLLDGADVRPGDLSARRQRRVRDPPRDRHVAMRVHERGSGETRSCGTGACAVMVAAAVADGVAGPPAEDLAYRVDVPGGTPDVTWTADRPGPARRPGRHRGPGYDLPTVF